jgi:hypothetical protein
MAWYSGLSKKIISDLYSNIGTNLNFSNRLRMSVINRTWISSMFSGFGTAYAIDSGKLGHIPFAIITPSAYIGYQLYKNRESVKSEVIEILDIIIL